jgi:hypothetical protein
MAWSGELNVSSPGRSVVAIPGTSTLTPPDGVSVDGSGNWLMLFCVPLDVVTVDGFIETDADAFGPTDVTGPPYTPIDFRVRFARGAVNSSAPLQDWGDGTITANATLGSGSASNSTGPTFSLDVGELDSPTPNRYVWPAGGRVDFALDHVVDSTTAMQFYRFDANVRRSDDIGSSYTFLNAYVWVRSRALRAAGPFLGMRR